MMKGGQGRLKVVAAFEAFLSSWLSSTLDANGDIPKKLTLSSSGSVSLSFLRYCDYPRGLW